MNSEAHTLHRLINLAFAEIYQRCNQPEVQLLTPGPGVGRRKLVGLVKGKIDGAVLRTGELS